jgi:hypothetical protein
MAEPDHVFVKPLPNLSLGDKPAAFLFFYIKPTENDKKLRKFFPEEKGPISNIDPIGNSPVIIKKVFNYHKTRKGTFTDEIKFLSLILLCLAL